MAKKKVAAPVAKRAFDTPTGGQRTPKAKPKVKYGVSGTPVWGGRVITRDKATQWQGQQRYTTISEMVSNISIVAASVHYFLNLLANPKWTVKPSDEHDAEAIELAAFVESVMHDMETPWPRIIRRAGMYRFYGFSVQEWTAKKRKDGRLGFHDVEVRPQHTIEEWYIDEAGTIRGMWQRSPQTGALLPLPREKVIYLVEDTLTDSPEGLGIFRHLLEPWIRLKQYLELEVRGFERDLRGIPVGRIPYTIINQAVKNGELTELEAKNMTEGLEEFVRLQVKQSDTGITLDSMPYESEAADGRKVASALQWGLELMTGSGSGLMELAHAIDRTQREMARIIGTEMLMMGDKTGNKATAQDKSHNLYLIANSVLDNIGFGFQKDFITPLWDLNGFPDEKKPTFIIEDVTFKDVEVMTRALKDMADAGASLSMQDPAINHIRDVAGIPRIDVTTVLEEMKATQEVMNPIPPAAPPVVPGKKTED